MTTRDEISAARRKKRIKYRLRRLMAFAIVVASIAAVFCLLSLVTPTTFRNIGDAVKTSFLLRSEYPIELSDKTPLQTALMDSSYAVLSEDEVLVFSSSGKNLFSTGHSFAEPEIDADGARFILFNRGNRETTICNRTSVLYNLRTDHPVIDAAISRDGTVVILTDSERNTAELKVYEPGGYETILSWYCSSGFPYACFVSDNGDKAAVFAAQLDDGGLYTDIYVIDIDGENELAKISVGDLGVEGLFDESRLVVLTDKSLHSFDFKGTEKYSYDFGGSPLLASYVSDGQLLAVATGDNSRTGVNSITVFSSGKHEKLFTISGYNVIKDLFTTKDRLYVLSSDVIDEFNIKGELIESIPVDESAKHIIYDKGLIAVLPNSIIKY